MSHPIVFRIFQTWELALAEVGVIYERKFTSRKKFADVEIFDEMERIWKLLGHRPSRQEWTQQGPKYSYKTYSDRFGGWVAACGSFIEYKSGQWPTTGTSDEEERSEVKGAISAKAEKPTPVGPRAIPLKIRFRVLDRDGYRCILCGKSPAMDLGIKLHIDHIVPYSKGGQSIQENLRTLCQNCNWGKGAD